MQKLFALMIIGILFFSMSPLLHFTSTASETPAVEWSKTFGEVTADSEQSVVQTSDGGYAIASWSWLIKTDSTGNAQWNNTYGDRAVSLVQTSDGGYAVVGNTIIGGYGIAWLAKTDSSGNMQWNKSYTEIGMQATAWSLIQTNDGGYVIAGCKEYYDGWLMKTDANGTMQWSRSFVEANNTQLQSVVQTNDGGYVAAGATQWPPFSGKVDAYVVKTDADGNTTWSAEFSRTAGNDYGRSIAQTGDGGYAIAGETDHWGNADFWLVKIDASGNFLWDRTYGGTGWDGANSIIQTSDGGYALAGQTNSFGAGGNDFWLVKTDADDNVQWNQTYGGAGDDGTGAVGSSVVQTLDGGYALCGYTNSFGGDGSYEVWLIKLAGSGPRTWIVDDDGPADSHTIQEAINAASDGDTILVRNGTYHEHVIMNRTVSLIGENRDSTIIDGSDNGDIVDIMADNVTINGFTLQNAGSSYFPGVNTGIYLDSSSNNNIVGNNITNNGIGIYISKSSNNSICGNNITANKWYGAWISKSSNNSICGNNITDYYWEGVRLDSSSYNSICGNNMTAKYGTGIFISESFDNSVSGNNITANNQFGVYVSESPDNSISGNNIRGNNGYGVCLNDEYSNNSIVSENVFAGCGLLMFSYGNEVKGNIVNGKPLIYLENISDYSVGDAGQVILVNCNNIRVENLNLSVASVGVELWNTNNTKIANDTITANNMCGVWISESFDNSVSGNNINNNGDGIRILHSSSNTIRDNVVKNNPYTSVGFNWGHDNIVYNNTIMNNYIGIGSESESYNNTFSENTVVGNSYGFLIDLYNSRFFHNNIINNNVQAEFYGSNYTNTWDDGYPSGGNFWSDYAGIDANSDGIGDAPYVIDSSNQDNYPLMHPWTPPDIAVVSSAASKTVVFQGLDLPINLTIQNNGNKIEGFNLATYANATMIQTQYFTLMGKNSTAIAFTWETSGFALGNYTMSAYAWPVSGETDTSDNNFTDGWIVVSMVGDLTGKTLFVPDGQSDGADIAVVAMCFGSYLGCPPPLLWYSNCDVDNNGHCDGADVALVAMHFGEPHP